MVITRERRRAGDFSQTLVQLGAYACVLVLLALAGREIIVQVQPPPAPVSAAQAPQPQRGGAWIDAGSEPALRGPVDVASSDADPR